MGAIVHVGGDRRSPAAPATLQILMPRRPRG
jgi:hypothetical protein